MGTAALSDLPAIQALRAAGCSRVLAKVMASNDNSKNQIYLGGSFDVLNELPLHSWTSEPSGDRTIIKAKIAWSWLQREGAEAPAPGAQLILYPQYPEVRLSGMLQRVDREATPASIIASRQAGRVLLIGIHPEGRVIAVALPCDHDEANTIRGAAPLLKGPGALLEIPLPEVGATSGDARTALLRALARVHRSGWIEGSRMRSSGEIVPYRAINGVGYTLEAQLGIRPNGRGEPDFLGWEVKALGVAKAGSVPRSKRITLMTPNPTGGEFASIGPAAFVRRYGTHDATTSARLNFGGMFRVGAAVGLNQLALAVSGFDPVNASAFDPEGAIRLETPDRTSAIEWTLTKMIEHWNRKHARAVYVPALADATNGRRRYWYRADVYLATGTDFAKMLTAVTSGKLVYDPGVKLEHMGSASESVKQRHQFRIAFGDLPALYNTWEVVDALSAS